ncbi:MAG: FHA domain-containing protein, partial [Dehalococcoidia bacterium]|nr:FHA domain-containing protein [Dehalococcoidia bacterium]
ISDDWITGRGLGTLAGGLLERLACPMVFVRSARGVGAPEVALRPEAAPDWPFIIPVGVRTDPPAPVRLPPQAHLQRLGPYGDTLEALTIGGVLSIGRAPDNRLALGDDNLVSRAHAAVEQRDGTFAVRDLSSTNGTFLWRDREWKEVKDEVLHNGDLLVIGANVFRFSEGSGHADA